MGLLRRCGFFRRRQEYDEACTSRVAIVPRCVIRVLDADRPMMSVNDLRNNRQSQAHSALLGRDEGIEYLLAQLRRNSWPGICNANLDSIAGSAVAHSTLGSSCRHL